MTVTILGVFDDALEGRRALEALRDGPLPLEDVSIITRQTDSGAPVSDSDDVSAGEGAAVGAVWGGLVGLGALLIPGIGPFIAGGALFAALTGAVTGAVVGGITAALVDFGGISSEEAARYEAMVNEGKTLVAVKAREEDALEVRRVLTEQGADSLREDDSSATGASSIGTSTATVDTSAPVAATGTSAAATPPRVAMYDSQGGRIDPSVDAASTGTRTTTSNAGNAWTSGEVVGEGQGVGPRTDTGTEDARQWVGEGQGTGPVRPDEPAILPPTTTDTNLPDPNDALRRKM